MSDAAPGPRSTYDQLRALLWLGVVPLVALVVLPFLLVEIGPSYEARFGGGTAGVFTARTSECDDSGTCRWSGDFVSDDGAVQRTGVRLIGGGVSAEGESVPAVDTGREQVYPEGGGWNWLIVTVFLAVLVGVLALWARSVRRRLLARRVRRAGG